MANAGALRARRAQYNVTQAELAVALKVDRWLVSRVERETIGLSRSEYLKWLGVVVDVAREKDEKKAAEDGGAK
jgi:hypothetical protein